MASTLVTLRGGPYDGRTYCLDERNVGIWFDSPPLAYYAPSHPEEVAETERGPARVLEHRGERPPRGG
jgi:hypothetical protein